jgi:hypothetical protein
VIQKWHGMKLEENNYLEDAAMKKFFTSFILLFVFVPAALLAGTRGEAANNFQQFQQEVNKAYASYRMALFQTNKKNQTKSLESAVSFQKQWQAITEKYIEAPPDIFANDPEWEATLVEIGNINALSINEMLSGQLSDAHDTLEAIRDELGALRQRNQVITFSDHVNNYHEAMESLLQLGLTSNDMDNKALIMIHEELAVLEYLAEEMKANAPVEYLKNEGFIQLMNGVMGSVKNLRQAVNEKKPDNILKAIKKLKPAYAKVFVKFG